MTMPLIATEPKLVAYRPDGVSRIAPKALCFAAMRVIESARVMRSKQHLLSQRINRRCIAGQTNSIG